MLAIDRQKTIEDMLNKNGSVIISSLSTILEVSEETIRRDLEKIGKIMNIKRVRGGAYLIDLSDKAVPIQIRETIYIAEKQIIADKCIKLINDDDSVALDSSTTSLYVAKAITNSKKKVTVITNSLKIVNEFSENTLVKVFCVGGILRKSTESFVGYMATDNLEKFSVDKAFVSCSAINSKIGITDDNDLEARARKKMFDIAMKKILVVDNTKFDSPKTNKICSISEIDILVTDGKVPDEYIEILNKSDVDII